MIAIGSLLLVVAISLLVTRVATVMLTATGLSREVARFQARSAFTGAGYTTTESESVVNHPVRRRIVMGADAARERGPRRGRQLADDRLHARRPPARGAQAGRARRGPARARLGLEIPARRPLADAADPADAVALYRRPAARPRRPAPAGRGLCRRRAAGRGGRLDGRAGRSRSWRCATRASPSSGSRTAASTTALRTATRASSRATRSSSTAAAPTSRSSTAAPPARPATAPTRSRSSRRRAA